MIEIERINIDKINKSKSVFLYNMLNDIRTPMNAIRGFTNLTLVKDMSQEKMVELLNKIKLSSVYLLSLIKDIFEKSRI